MLFTALLCSPWIFTEEVFAVTLLLTINYLFSGQVPGCLVLPMASPTLDPHYFFLPWLSKHSLSLAAASQNLLWLRLLRIPKLCQFVGNSWLSFAAGRGSADKHGLVALQACPLSLLRGAVREADLCGLFLMQIPLICLEEKPQAALSLPSRVVVRAGNSATSTCTFHSASCTNTLLTHLLLQLQRSFLCCLTRPNYWYLSTGDNLSSVSPVEILKFRESKLYQRWCWTDPYQLLVLCAVNIHL